MHQPPPLVVLAPNLTVVEDAQQPGGRQLPGGRAAGYLGQVDLGDERQWTGPVGGPGNIRRQAWVAAEPARTDRRRATVQPLGGDLYRWLGQPQQHVGQVGEVILPQPGQQFVAGQGQPPGGGAGR
jgi:hypothetical protein